MQTTLPVVVGLLLVALLTLVCSCRVEQDVQAVASAAVSEAGHEWAHVEADGRFVRVTGTAASPAAVSNVLGTALAPEAVVRVVDDTEFRALDTADLNPVRGGLAGAGMRWVDLGWRDWTLELNGLASDEDDKQRAEAVAEPLWPWGPVDNRIRVPGADIDRSALACRSSANALLADETVQFDSGSAALSVTSHQMLDRLAGILAGCSDTRFAIEAHSDNTGEAESNLVLSQSRAQSVVDYLAGAGVAATQMRAVGFGESRPIADNATEEGRALNRRVEFRLDY